MKRPFPRFEVLGLTAALALGAACNPNQSVPPGAPVLTTLSILEPGPYGPVATQVTASTLMCPAGTSAGNACDPIKYPTCETVPDSLLCRCVAGMAPSAPPPTSDAGVPDAGAAASDGSVDAAALTGGWSCSFAPQSMILYTFDRILYTPPLDPGDAGVLYNLTQSPTPTFVPTPPMTVMLGGNYNPTGAPNSVIFPLLGDFRSDGPSILFTANTGALPTGTTIGVTLDKTKVLAKDGRTPFTGMNLLQDGTINFATAPFTVAVNPPPLPPKAADAGADAAAPTDQLPDMTPATATFNTPINLTALQGPPGLITASAMPIAGGAAVNVPVTLTSTDNLTVTITPVTTWPPSSTITIDVDATTSDGVGDTLGATAAAAAATSFMTSAM